MFLGPIERVSIPTDKEGRIKTFGFVEYKHLVSVDYALNLFAGTRLFGRELMLRNRSSKGNQRNDPSHHIQPSMSLMHGSNLYGNQSHHSPMVNNLNPTQAHIQKHQPELLQQQLMLMATANNIQNYMNQGTKIFNATEKWASAAPGEGYYGATSSDRNGSHREQFADRRRDHRDDIRSSRSKPYRRSRSRSPNRYRDRDNSPHSFHQRHLSNSRNSRKHDDRYGRR